MSDDLSKLVAEAAAADLLAAPPAEAIPQEAEPVAVTQVDRMAEAVMIVGLLRPAAGMVFAAVKAAPDEEWIALHEPIAELLAFYSVDVTKYLNSPWAKLAAASVPLVVRVWAAAEKDAPAEKPIEKPDATVSVGEPELALFAARG